MAPPELLEICVISIMHHDGDGGARNWKPGWSLKRLNGGIDYDAP
jgi:hypothetical protein